jgi:hypothetical protein
MKSYYHIDAELSIHSTSYRTSKQFNPSLIVVNLDSFEAACRVITTEKEIQDVHRALFEAECTAEFELGWLPEQLEQPYV